MKIAEIEKKIINKEEISKDELVLLLEYIISSVRDIVGDYTFNYKCDFAQGLIGDYLNKLGIKNFPCLTNHCINPNVVGHSFIIADFNNIKYIIDPAYVQFLYYDNNYDDVFINNMRVKTKSPLHYGLKLDKDLINNFIKNGYMELNEHNAFVYGNSFYNTMTGTQADFSYPLIDGNTFVNKFLEGNEILRFYGTDCIEVMSENNLKR